MTKKRLDLLCMGRACVDFYSEQVGASLEEARIFTKYVGGCPANIAIGASRLGLKTGVLSRVGDEAMGRFVRETLASEGVDVTHLKTDPKHLTGMVLLGVNPPDNFPLIFYRENCADMAMEEEDISLEVLEQTKALLITGTQCSQEQGFRVALKAAQLAKLANAKVIIDLDYRPVLWGATGHGGGEKRYVKHALVSERITPLIQHADLIVGTEEEILVAANCNTLDEAIAYLQIHSEAIIVQKCGEKGCLVHPEGIMGHPFSVEVLNVLGAGDAFMSGFLRGFLKNLPLEQCCTLANANGALVVTRHGCSPAMPYWDELQAFIRQPTDIDRTEHLHNLMGRRQWPNDLAILAFDHRSHFEKRDPSQVRKVKTLIYQGFLASKVSGGIIADRDYGQNDLPFEGRCIEKPGAFPLEFLDGKEAAHVLRSWPTSHVVKVLCYGYSEEQIEKLRHLYEVTKQTGHTLLIELIEEVEEMIQACYQAKIFPDWWKLPTIENHETWHRIEQIIEENDPYCLGILLLGGNQPLEELKTTIQKLKTTFRKIKGFAVGRTIWGDSVENWFDGTISDQEVIDTVAHRFSLLAKGVTDDSNTRELITQN